MGGGVTIIFEERIALSGDAQGASPTAKTGLLLTSCSLTLVPLYVKFLIRETFYVAVVRAVLAMKKTVSLKDVAKRAGVSLGTASKVMNDAGNVNDRMREDVLRAANELNYIPNVIARTLKTNLTYTIGVIIPEMANTFFDEVIGGIQDYFEPKGYSVLIYNTHLDSNEEFRAFDIFNQKVDGIIFVSNTITDELFATLKDLSIPVVFVATYVKDFISININNEMAAFTAVDFLCKKGHKNIAHLSGDPDDINAGGPRLEGYKKALKSNNIPVDPKRILEGQYKFEDGIINTRKFLALDDKITAIFAASDTMAVGALNAIHSKGLKVPEDISVVGFDDVTIARYASPSLTTVKQPRYNMGKEGAEKLYFLMTGKDVEIKNYILEYKLIIRDSTN